MELLPEGTCSRVQWFSSVFWKQTSVSFLLCCHGSYGREEIATFIKPTNDVDYFPGDASGCVMVGCQWQV